MLQAKLAAALISLLMKLGLLGVVVFGLWYIAENVPSMPTWLEVLL